MQAQLRDLALQLINAPKAFEIRDVDAGEEPFLYSSGNMGPLFLSVKGTVSFPFFWELAEELAGRVYEILPEAHFVAGNVTGGVPPSMIVARALGLLHGHHVPFVYVRESRKKGGQREHVTGLNNPAIEPGMNALIGEELINYATTTTNSGLLLRDLGFVVTHGMGIVTYDSPTARLLLRQHAMSTIALFTMTEILDLAEESGNKPPCLIAQAREFVGDPDAWMASRGLIRNEKGGTR